MEVKYDFFVAGRWRNYSEIRKVLELIRSKGKSAYCFIENVYPGEKIEFQENESVFDTMQKLEALDLNDAFIKKVYETDLTAQRNSDNFILVLPAGISGHMEAGIAYGLGKKCYAVGVPEKTETLYRIFERIFKDQKELEIWL